MQGRHSLASLRAALVDLGADIDEYTPCRVEIRSQIAAYVGRTGHARVAAVTHDCVTHGALTRNYSRATLRRALRHLPVDVAQYTTCGQVITSQASVQR